MVNFCWIDPAGVVYPVESHRHGKFAQEFLRRPDLSITDATYLLVSLGWLRISVAGGISTIPFDKLPEQQASALLTLLTQVMSGIIKQNIVAYIHA